MAFALTAHSYGKAEIRVATIERDGDWHDFHDLTVTVRLEGDFHEAYTVGDNATTLPTDTLRATAYAFAADMSLAETEPYLEALGRRLLAASPRVAVVHAEAVVHAWDRLAAGGSPHPHAFRRGSGDGFAAVSVGRDGPVTTIGGLVDLQLLKTTASSFTGFLTDEFTVLKPARDRILATAVEARWTWASPPVSYAAARATAQLVIEEVFATTFSRAVQETLHAAGAAVLEAVPELAEVRLRMPNRHHVPVDLSPFGRANDNEVFVVTDRPYGVIEGTVTRA